MWLNHMMQPENPLSNGKSYDFEYYGDDPDGPTPLDSDNNVVVEEIDLDNIISAVICIGKARSLKRIKSNGSRHLPRGSRTCDS